MAKSLVRVKEKRLKRIYSMKITYALLLTLALNQASATESVKGFGFNVTKAEVKSRNLPPIYFQDRSNGNFNMMMSELSRVHKELYALPYSYDHIKGVFMPEIETQRLVVAPHYPSRQAIGTNQDLATTLFREWWDNYPQESTDYISYVQSFISSH